VGRERRLSGRRPASPTKTAVAQLAGKFPSTTFVTIAARAKVITLTGHIFLSSKLAPNGQTPSDCGQNPKLGPVSFPSPDHPMSFFMSFGMVK
jgi:hypothetical protein